MRNVLDFLMVAALGGGSYLFNRIAVPEFGPLALIGLRIAIAATTLLPVLWLSGNVASLRRHARPLFVAGLLNAAIPFFFLAYAAQSLNAGFVALLNATQPMFGAVIAFVYLKQAMSASKIAGLFIGLGGVTILVWGMDLFKPGGSGLAVAAALAAALSLSIGALYTRARLSKVAPLAITTGSQLGAALAVLPLAVWQWPQSSPTGAVWLSVLGLGVPCTALVYLLYYRLIGSVGAANATATSFLIPVFGVLWGAVFLGEKLSAQTMAGCACILCGTALATGLWKLTGVRLRWQ